MNGDNKGKKRERERTKRFHIVTQTLLAHRTYTILFPACRVGLIYSQVDGCESFQSILSWKKSMSKFSRAVTEG